MKQKLQAWLAAAKAILQAFWAKVNQDIKTIWAQDKVFLIAFGALILTIKFRDIIIDLLVSSAKRIFTKAQSQNSQLQQQENTANAQADQLVKEAQQLPSTEKPISEDWYKEPPKGNS